MKNKIIGISANIEIATDSIPFAGSKRLRLYYDYVSAVIKAGGIPVVIPVTTDKKVLAQHIDLIDGLIISGGYDIDPLRYNEEPHPLLQATFPERDEFEFTLMEMAMKKKIPLLGICRGHQILNVLNGGSLYQDISLKGGNVLKHAQSSIGSTLSHSITVENGSMLFDILGPTSVVNSLHHLAIKDLAPNFKAVAYSSDGVIEAIEYTGDSFAMGVQWHPEALAHEHDNMSKLFEYFLKKC